MQRGAWVAGRFEILAVAGRGATSTVYQARDLLHGGQQVALKVLGGVTGAALERFERESRLLATIEHSAVVRYVAHGKTGAGQTWLALEWLSGETLAARLERGTLSADDALAMAGQLLDGLIELHGRGVVHRDVKPANIVLVDGEPARAKLLDLGIARLLNASLELTMTGEMLGTPAYLAPEQARGEANVDGKADLFAFGVVLHRALSGARPFDAPDTLGVLLKILFEEPTRLSRAKADIPEALDELVAALLSKSAALRPDAKEARSRVAALQRARSEPSPHSAPRAVGTQRGVAPGRGLSLSERKTVCLAVARCFATDVEAVRAGVTRAESDLAALGARLVCLADGSYLIASERGTSASLDTAVVAARAALAFCSWVKASAVAVASVKADIASDDLMQALGKAAERAAGMLSAGPAPLPRIDDATRALLGERFETAVEGAGFLLVGERPGTLAHTTLVDRAIGCLGRQAELDTLGAELEASRQGPRVALVLGPAGAGKSRIAAEVLRVAEAEGCTVHVARADPMSPGAPLSMLSQIICRAARIDVLEPKRTRREKLRACAAFALGDEHELTAAFLGELCGTRFDDDHLAELRAARFDARLMGDRIQRAFLAWLGGECARNRVLLILEDLHWGDVPSARLLAEAAQRLESAPLFVLGLARGDAPHELLNTLGGLHLELGALSHGAAVAIARAGLGAHASTELVERVVRRASGNVFFLEEIVRVIAQGRGEQLPEAVLATIQARLDDLSQACRRVLRAASVFGMVFHSESLRGLLPDVADGDLARSLGELVEREVLEDATAPGTNPGAFAFRHGLVRDAAYAMLPEDDRRFAHRAAAHWLDQTGFASARAVATHFEQGGQAAEAARACREAAQAALDSNDFHGVLELLERATKLGLSGSALGELRVLGAEAERWRGEHGRAERVASSALPLLEAETAAWYAALGEIALASGRVGHSERLDEVVVTLRASPPPVERRARALRRIAAARAAVHLITGGQLEKANPLCEELEANASDDDDAVRARVHQTAAFRALLSGDLYAYLVRMTEATRAFERAGDFREATIQLINVGNASAQLGRAAQAESALREALAAARHMRLSNVVAYAEHNLGITLARAGNAFEGLAIEQRARDAFAQQGDRRMEGVARIYAAQILTMLRRHDEAIAEACAAEALLEKSPPAMACALATKSAALLASAGIGTSPEERGALAREALTAAGLAQALLEKLGAIEEGEFLVRTSYVEALLACQHVAEATERAHAAKRFLLDRAARIADSAVRSQFLHGVADNARTIALSETLGS